MIERVEHFSEAKGDAAIRTEKGRGGRGRGAY